MTPTTNSVFVWGRNIGYILGIKSPFDKHVIPVRNISLSDKDIVDIQGGIDFTLALDKSGQVWSFGGNEYGQCGQGTDSQECPIPIMIEGLKKFKIVQIQAGQYHGMGLTNDGQVLSWGYNDYGQVCFEMS